MQQWVRLVEVKTDPIIQVAPIVVASPEIEEVHGSTRQARLTPGRHIRFDTLPAMRVR